MGRRDPGWSSSTADVELMGEQVFRWEYETAGKVRSSPTVVDETVYIGSHDNHIYALNRETGKRKWTTETGDTVSASPTVADKRVVVGSHDHVIYGLDRESGDSVWTYETDGPVYTSPTVIDGVTFAGSDDGCLRALEEGQTLWTFETGVSIRSSPTVVDDTVFFGCSDGTVYAVDTATGERNWQASTMGTAVRSSPTVSDGRVFVGGLDGQVYCHRSSNGNTVWRYNTRDSVWSSPTVLDGTVFVGDRAGYLYALDVETGSPVWEYHTRNDIFSSPTVTKGTVFIGSDSNRLYAIDSETGTANWAVDTTGSIRSSPTVVEGILYVGSYDTSIYAIETDTEASSADTRIVHQTLGHHETTTDETIAVQPPRFEIRAVETNGPISTGETLELTFDVTNTGELEGAQKTTATVEDSIVWSQEMTLAPEQTVTETIDIEIPTGDAGERSVVLSTETTTETVQITIDDQQQRTTDQPSGHDRSEDDTDSDPTTGDNVPDQIPEQARTSLTYDTIEKQEPIGSGGNADVYHATVGDSGEFECAIKEPRMTGTVHTENVERLLKEAETWQQLDSHDYIISVIDYGSQPLPWIGMEYMDAGHLGERADEFGYDQKLWTAIATAKAVSHAHRRGIAHLDLKPENILFRSVEKRWDVPKIGDWGLSKHLLNHSKSIKGMSPHYAAPEQFDEEYGSTDDITDVYQLGAVFYDLFTGQPPFEGRPVKVMNKVMTSQVTPPSEIADVPQELDEVLLSALKKEKENRYEHVLYLRDELQTLYEQE